MSHDNPFYCRNRLQAIARDGGRCTFPGCTSRRRLETHHVWPSRHGGPDNAGNLRTYCQRHHDLADRYAEMAAQAIRGQLTAPVPPAPVSRFTLAASSRPRFTLAARPMPTAPPAVPPAPPSLLFGPTSFLEAVRRR